MDARQRERIYEAKRAGIVARVSHAVGADRAEEVMSAWEAQAAALSLPRESTAFWTEVEPWIAAAASRQRAGRRP